MSKKFDGLLPDDDENLVVVGFVDGSSKTILVDWGVSSQKNAPPPRSKGG